MHEQNTLMYNIILFENGLKMEKFDLNIVQQNIEVLKNNRIRGEIAQSQAHKTHKYVNNAWSEMSNSPPALLFIPFHVPLH